MLCLSARREIQTGISLPKREKFRQAECLLLCAFRMLWRASLVRAR